ncbi:hypothetical protein PR202_gb22736 [Eleusine coracana subsp. coracana]|uniref:Helicase C-terminal domain-containing protein n=1 Tax=Eleusine coracana subsp. coracana TaxID=191504 RepID=A0AAV5FGL0_ELECO|nr:hypothetical protein PR202_gb22736 [Eleusine coracana subsp. coracana]
MALHHLRLAPLALLRLAPLQPLANSRLATRQHQLLFFSPPARQWRLLSPAARPRALATAATEANDTGAGSGDGFFAEERTSWKSLGISDRLASALRGAGLARPSLVQVVRMANSLLDDSGEPFKSAAAVCGPKVFDEADMLLCGSFENQVIRLIHMLRFDEKLLSRAKDSGKEVPLTSDDEYHEDSDSEIAEYSGGDDENEDNHVDNGPVKMENGHARARKDWRRVRKIYSRSKQYVFVAATLPQSGKRTAGGVLKRMFPEAVWVSGTYLHCHNPRLERRWIEVTADTQVDALLDAVKYGMKSEVQDSDVPKRTMVFTNTVDAANSVSNILHRVNVPCILYHRETPMEERAKNLQCFRERGGVLVCTDAASRGLDIPNISHVIQV